ncbi:MAG: efflux RND transporter periplasmic adaptor subunit [Deltaproteobacteria bacterium]|nr:efflux RND transporter periplasmic adaptor subunit [Deltaproteobacteria bacterium]
MKLLRFLMNNKRFVVWPLLALAAFAGLKKTVLAPQEVKTARIERRDLTAQVYGNGTVEAKVVVPVSTKTTGRILDLYADQGDFVKRGQLLAKLENDDVNQQVLQAQAGLEKTASALAMEEANLKKAKANLELAEKNAGRFRNLAERNLVSRMEAEQYENTYRVAKEEVARVTAAIEVAGRDQTANRANLGVARTRVADTLVYAPESGLIISRDLERGATVTPGVAIFRLADPRTVWVAANVDESQLGGVAVGKKAQIALRSAPGKLFLGRVARLGRESDRVTEESEVDVAFDPPLTDFRLGEQAEVYIVSQVKPAAPCVTAKALASRGKNRGVWLVEGEKLRFREVGVGIEDRKGLSEVLSGLTGNEVIALAPAEKMLQFKEGQRVKVAR